MTKNGRWAAILLMAALIGTGAQTAAAAEIGVLNVNVINRDSRVVQEARARMQEQPETAQQECEQVKLRMEQAAEQVAAEQGVELVLFSGGVAWGGRDITAETLRRMDQEGAQIAVAGVVRPSAVPETVGVIDTNRVMAQSVRVQQVREKMRILEISLTETLRTEKERLSEAEYAERSVQLQQNAEASARELQDEFKQAFDQAVDKVATDKRLTIVLHKGGVAQGGVDITAEVMQVMQ